nr:heparan sulfate glucosamine 3-O-sulfotransferase 1-like [Lytechinus pictus]
MDSQAVKNSDRATARRLNCRQRLPNVIGLGVQKCGTGALVFAAPRDWLSVFPRSLPCRGRQRVDANPLSVLQEVEEFLELPKYFDESKVYFNASKGFYCLRDEKKECMGQGKGRTHPKMSAELEQRLREFYHPYNLEMEKLVGRKFSWA